MLDLPRALPATVLALGLLTGTASHAVPSSELTVTGAVATVGKFDLAGLQALPAVTQTDIFVAGTTSQIHTYTGANLWGIVSSVGISVDPSIKNDVLNKYVLATGTDGYRTVFSMGELNPGFGNKADLFAYAERVNAVSAPLSANDGFARTTAVGDIKGGRYVSNLGNLDVRGSGSTQLGTGGGLSTSFSVTGGVTMSMNFDLSALMGLPSVTETFGGHTYVGVSFWDLLNTTVGITVDPGVKNDVLNKYVVATGSDGYQTLFSMGELDSAFGNQPDMVAYQVDGTSLGSNGFARLVVPNDVKAGRWVSRACHHMNHPRAGAARGVAIGAGRRSGSSPRPRLATTRRAPCSPGPSGGTPQSLHSSLQILAGAQPRLRFAPRLQTLWGATRG